MEADMSITTRLVGRRPGTSEVRYVNRAIATGESVTPSPGPATRVNGDQPRVDRLQANHAEPGSLDKLEKLFWSLAIDGRAGRLVDDGDPFGTASPPEMSAGDPGDTTGRGPETPGADAPVASALPQPELSTATAARPVGDTGFYDLFALSGPEKSDIGVLAADMDDIDSRDLLARGLDIINRLKYRATTYCSSSPA
jgi:hypothetical protein